MKYNIPTVKSDEPPFMEFDCAGSWPVTEFIPECEEDIHALAVMIQHGKACLPFYRKRDYIPSIDYCKRYIRWMMDSKKHPCPDAETDEQLQHEAKRAQVVFSV